MLIKQPNPEDMVVVTTNHTCDYHKRNPNDRSWPGCTCGGSYGYRKKTEREKEDE